MILLQVASRDKRRWRENRQDRVRLTVACGTFRNDAASMQLQVATMMRQRYRSRAGIEYVVERADGGLRTPLVPPPPACDRQEVGACRDHRPAVGGGDTADRHARYFHQPAPPFEDLKVG